MKRPAKIMTAIAALIALVLVLLIALPLLFRDRIAQRAKLGVNQNLDARVDWRDAGLSFFRNFPHLTLTLDDLTTVGTGRFENDTLAAVRHLGVVLDLPSVLGNAMGGKPLVIRAIDLDRPRLALIALEDGSANWDITKKTATQPAPQASKPFAVSLRRFDISDGSIVFDNRQSKLLASLTGFNGIAERGLQPKPGCDPDARSRRHRERHLRWNHLPQSRRARTRCRRASRSREQALHACRTPSSRSTTLRSKSPDLLRRLASDSRSTSRCGHPPRASTASSRSCPRSMHTTSTR